MGQLPEQMEANLRALDRLQTELTATDDLLHGQGDRLSRTEKSIKEYEAGGTAGADSDNPKSVNTVMDPLVARLHELERRLDLAPDRMEGDLSRHRRHEAGD